jgi:hypothetical protein
MPGSVCHPLRNVPPTEAPHLGQVHYSVEKLSSNVAGEQPIAVMAEHRGHPYRLVYRQSNEPAEEQIVVQLLINRRSVHRRRSFCCALAGRSQSGAPVSGCHNAAHLPPKVLMDHAKFCGYDFRDLDTLSIPFAKPPRR